VDPGRVRADTGGIMNRLPLLAAFLLSSPARTLVVRGGEVLERRAHEVAALVGKDPKWADDLFDKNFLKQVPPAKLTPILEHYFDMIGKVVDVQLREQKSEYSAVCDLIGEKDQVVQMTIALDSKPPNSIVGLLFGNPAPMTKDLAAAAAEIAKLPGSTSFGVWKLGGEKPEPVVTHEPDRALALGSTFKLYVLGALAKEVTDGKRKLEEVVRLEEKWRSLPSGQMQSWPVGTPVTLQTLASMMISISDNTATDHLLFTLGRGKVEAMLALMGNEHAEKSLPFLSTGEMFRLKGAIGGKAADEYASLDAAKKREMLEKKIDPVLVTEKSVDLSAFASPVHVEDIEWFASASDLCRAMDWLRRATESGPAAPVRGVLAINPGLSVSKEAFPYVGFKGGSETGVINLTFLLRAKDGTWYAASAGWNDPTEAVEESKLTGLMQRVLYLLGKGGEKKEEGK
jgi:beta-lactamase class A